MKARDCRDTYHAYVTVIYLQFVQSHVWHTIRNTPQSVVYLGRDKLAEEKAVDLVRVILVL